MSKHSQKRFQHLDSGHYTAPGPYWSHSTQHTPMSPSSIDSANQSYSKRLVYRKLCWRTAARHRNYSVFRESNPSQVAWLHCRCRDCSCFLYILGRCSTGRMEARNWNPERSCMSLWLVGCCWDRLVRGQTSSRMVLERYSRLLLLGLR